MAVVLFLDREYLPRYDISKMLLRFIFQSIVEKEKKHIENA